MRNVIFFIVIVLLYSPVHADNQKETCRSYLIDLSINKKYCLLDADDKIAEFDRKLHKEQNTQWLNELQKDDPGPFPEQPIKQTENK